MSASCVSKALVLLLGGFRGGGVDESQEVAGLCDTREKLLCELQRLASVSSLASTTRARRARARVVPRRSLSGSSRGRTRTPRRRSSLADAQRRGARPLTVSPLPRARSPPTRCEGGVHRANRGDCGSVARRTGLPAVRVDDPDHVLSGDRVDERLHTPLELADIDRPGVDLGRRGLEDDGLFVDPLERGSYELADLPTPCSPHEKHRVRWAPARGPRRRSRRAGAFDRRAGPAARRTADSRYGLRRGVSPRTPGLERSRTSTRGSLRTDRGTTRAVGRLARDLVEWCRADDLAGGDAVIEELRDDVDPSRGASRASRAEPMRSRSVLGVNRLALCRRSPGSSQSGRSDGIPQYTRRPSRFGHPFGSTRAAIAIAATHPFASRLKSHDLVDVGAPRLRALRRLPRTQAAPRALRRSCSTSSCSSSSCAASEQDVAGHEVLDRRSQTPCRGSCCSSITSSQNQAARPNAPMKARMITTCPHDLRHGVRTVAPGSPGVKGRADGVA